MLARIRPAARLLALSALLVGGAVAAACGDDDDNTTPVNSAATTAAPTKAESPAAQSPTAKPTTAAASATTGGATQATAKTVTIADNTFSPGNLTVTKGTKVTWNWTGQNPHSVVGTSDNAKSIKSETHQSTGTFEFTFDTPGTYQYQCGVHGAAMAGTITVQ